MTTLKQKTAAKRNIKKAQSAWRRMTHRQHALSQPEGRLRQKPGTTGRGKFYRIEVRPKNEFTSFRVQDVGKRGGLERLAGRRGSGSWDTVSWLVSKKDAHIERGRLIIHDAKAQSVLRSIRGPITHVKGMFFTLSPEEIFPRKINPHRNSAGLKWPILKKRKKRGAGPDKINLVERVGQKC